MWVGFGFELVDVFYVFFGWWFYVEFCCIEKFGFLFIGLGCVFIVFLVEFWFFEFDEVDFGKCFLRECMGNVIMGWRCELVLDMSEWVYVVYVIFGWRFFGECCCLCIFGFFYGVLGDNVFLFWNLDMLFGFEFFGFVELLSWWKVYSWSFFVGFDFGFWKWMMWVWGCCFCGWVKFKYVWSECRVNFIMGWIFEWMLGFDLNDCMCYILFLDVEFLGLLLFRRFCFFFILFWVIMFLIWNLDILFGFGCIWCCRVIEFVKVI